MNSSYFSPSCEVVLQKVPINNYLNKFMNDPTKCIKLNQLLMIKPYLTTTYQFNCIIY